MKLYLNDLADVPKKVDELDGTLICMSGHDKPKYIDARAGGAGDLGFDTWIEHWNKPVGVVNGVGTLTQNSWYAISVVPVDRDIVTGDDFQRGTPTLQSIPVQAVGATDAIDFTIPTHTQNTTYECGDATGIATNVMTDSTKAWTVDEWIGYILLDVETGDEYLISDNDATTITATGCENTIVATSRYQIVKRKATARDIYACQLANASDISGAEMIYQGTIDENTSTLYTLASYVDSAVIYPANNIPPDNYAYCTVADNRVFAGGGVTESRGLAFAVNTETQLVAGGAPSDFTFAVVTELYSGSNFDKVMSCTLGAGLTPPTDLYIGSFITIAGTAGNDIEDAQLLYVSADKTVFHFLNNSGTAGSETAGTIDINPNVIKSSVVPADVTYFTEGLRFATFAFTGEVSYTIGWIDPINNLFTLSQKYEGSSTTDTAFEINSSYNLSWSDYGNPHIWRSENQSEIADEIKSIVVFQGLIIVFCSRSMWKIPLNNLTQTATLITENVNFTAPFSVVTTPRGIMFHDGVGFSVTDGQSIASVTQYKATDLLRSINNDMAYNIRGVYDSTERRVEFVFPMGTDITNNYGLYITLDSLNVYPFSRLDCNAVWEDEDADGRPIIMHGTSGRHVTSGKGYIYSHPYEQPTDGDFGSSVTSGQVTAVNADHLVISTGGSVTLGEGTYCLYYPKDSTGQMVQFIAFDVVETVAGSEYEVYFGDDWYSDAFEVDGYIYFTMIPFDYGIKWLDFSSPQYQHKIRQVQIDVREFIGSMYIEHYGDLDPENPIQIDHHVITSQDTKIIVKLKKSSYYTYGFRLRGYSSTQANLLSFEILFDTEV